MNTLVLKLDDQTSLTVYLHGATITSWIADNEEILFVSKKSIFDNKKAIRGGIPVVFPNFGPWSENRPQHGFARTKQWLVKTPVHQTDDSVSVTLSLEDDEETRNFWNYKFELNYQMTLKKDYLKLEFIVHNKSETCFDFTSLLHTYFRLDIINNAKLHGFKNSNYSDKLQNGQTLNETNEFITITAETDRIYYQTNNEHILETGNANSHKILINKQNFPDTVVWNPWIDKSKAMVDFDDEEYKQMICAEVGHVYKPFTLQPNEIINMNQELKIQ